MSASPKKKHRTKKGNPGALIPGQSSDMPFEQPLLDERPSKPPPLLQLRRSDVSEPNEQSEQASAPSRRIFVGNIGPNTTRQELQLLFQQFGSVSDVFVPQYRSEFGGTQNRGFAFVEFASLEVAERVRQLLRAPDKSRPNAQSNDDKVDVDTTTGISVVQSNRMLTLPSGTPGSVTSTADSAPTLRLVLGGRQLIIDRADPRDPGPNSGGNGGGPDAGSNGATDPVQAEADRESTLHGALHGTFPSRADLQPTSFIHPVPVPKPSPASLLSASTTMSNKRNSFANNIPLLQENLQRQQDLLQYHILGGNRVSQNLHCLSQTHPSSSFSSNASTTSTSLHQPLSQSSTHSGQHSLRTVGTLATQGTEDCTASVNEEAPPRPTPSLALSTLSLTDGVYSSSGPRASYIPYHDPALSELISQPLHSMSEPRFSDSTPAGFRDDQDDGTGILTSNFVFTGAEEGAKFVPAWVRLRDATIGDIEINPKYLSPSQRGELEGAATTSPGIRFRSSVLGDGSTEQYPEEEVDKSLGEENPVVGALLTELLERQQEVLLSPLHQTQDTGQSVLENADASAKVLQEKRKEMADATQSALEGYSSLPPVGSGKAEPCNAGPLVRSAVPSSSWVGAEPKSSTQKGSAPSAKKNNESSEEIHYLDALVQDIPKSEKTSSERSNGTRENRKSRSRKKGKQLIEPTNGRGNPPTGLLVLHNSEVSSRSSSKHSDIEPLHSTNDNIKTFHSDEKTRDIADNLGTDAPADSKVEDSVTETEDEVVDTCRSTFSSLSLDSEYSPSPQVPPSILSYASSQKSTYSLRHKDEKPWALSFSSTNPDEVLVESVESNSLLSALSPSHRACDGDELWESKSRQIPSPSNRKLHPLRLSRSILFPLLSDRIRQATGVFSPLFVTDNPEKQQLATSSMPSSLSNAASVVGYDTVGTSDAGSSASNSGMSDNTLGNKEDASNGKALDHQASLTTGDGVHARFSKVLAPIMPPASAATSTAPTSIASNILPSTNLPDVNTFSISTDRTGSATTVPIAFPALSSISDGSVDSTRGSLHRPHPHLPLCPYKDMPPLNNHDLRCACMQHPTEQSVPPPVTSGSVYLHPDTNRASQPGLTSDSHIRNDAEFPSQLQNDYPNASLNREQNLLPNTYPAMPPVSSSFATSNGKQLYAEVSRATTEHQAGRTFPNHSFANTGGSLNAFTHHSPPQDMASSHGNFLPPPLHAPMQLPLPMQMQMHMQMSFPFLAGMNHQQQPHPVPDLRLPQGTNHNNSSGMEFPYISNCLPNGQTHNISSVPVNDNNNSGPDILNRIDTARHQSAGTTHTPVWPLDPRTFPLDDNAASQGYSNAHPHLHPHPPPHASSGSMPLPPPPPPPPGAPTLPPECFRLLQQVWQGSLVPFASPERVSVCKSGQERLALGLYDTCYLIRELARAFVLPQSRRFTKKAVNFGSVSHTSTTAASAATQKTLQPSFSHQSGGGFQCSGTSTAEGAGGESLLPTPHAKDRLHADSSLYYGCGDANCTRSLARALQPEFHNMLLHAFSLRSNSTRQSSPLRLFVGKLYSTVTAPVLTAHFNSIIHYVIRTEPNFIMKLCFIFYAQRLQALETRVCNSELRENGFLMLKQHLLDIIHQSNPGTYRADAFSSATQQPAFHPHNVINEEGAIQADRLIKNAWLPIPRNPSTLAEKDRLLSCRCADMSEVESEPGISEFLDLLHTSAGLLADTPAPLRTALGIESFFFPVDATGGPRGFAFVAFTNHTSLLAFLYYVLLNPIVLEGKQIVIDAAFARS